MNRRASQQGLSLVEVLMIMTFLSLTMVGFMMLMTQTSQNSKGTYVQSSRSLLLNELLAEMSPDRPTFAALFTDAALNTATSESGQVIPYMRKVDLTNAGATTAMKRTSHFYLYNTASDATSAPRYKTTVVQSSDVLRLRFGNVASVIDTLGQTWYGDGGGSAILYDSTNKVPGATATYTAGSIANDILNTQGNDDSLFQNYRRAASMSFSFDVENGPYTVKLYFAEYDATVTSNSGSTPRHTMNISLESAQVNTNPYSPCETTGGAYRADIQTYDVTVSDGTLNVALSVDSTSDVTKNQVFLNAIEIRKRNTL